MAGKENMLMTPAYTRGVSAFTPMTAVLSPLNFSPLTAAGKKNILVNQSVTDAEEARRWKHIAHELDAALTEVMKDGKECASLLSEKDTRLTALESELDSTKSAHEELGALLSKSMEREKEKAKKVEASTTEINEWKAKYQKLYEDAKAKIALSVEKIDHYKKQLRGDGQKSEEVANKVIALEQEVMRLRAEAEGRENETRAARNSGAHKRIHTQTDEELQKAQLESRHTKLELQRAQGEILELAQSRQNLEDQLCALQLKTQSPRRLSGGSGRERLNSTMMSPWQKGE